MPTRHIVKEYGAGNYYHVYNRGVNKTNIFRDDADFRYFLTLLKQRLSPEVVRDRQRRVVANFQQEVDLVAYCLMPNHYHMLLYMKEDKGIERFMRSLMTAYSGYFNRRHTRVGALFQNHFLASRITTNSYLWQVSRYIHLNPIDIKQDYSEYPYSSLRYYAGHAVAEWVSVRNMVDSLEDQAQYIKFVAAGAADHEYANKIKYILANNPDI